MRGPLLDYVEDVLAEEVLVVSQRQTQLLTHLGARRKLFSRTKWYIRFHSNAELAQILDALRNAEFAFAGAQSGWPPSAVFQHLRDKQMLSGTFKEVRWLNRDEIVVREK